jgi:hypothetical protein
MSALDDGTGARGIVAMGRHPKPFTKADASNRSNPLFDHLIGERET